MLNLIPDKTTFDKLFLNLALLNNSVTCKSEDNILSDEEKETIINESYNILNKYYYAKYQEDMLNNPEILLVVDSKDLKNHLNLSDIEYKYFDDSVRIISSKSYLNPKHPNYLQPTKLKYANQVEEKLEFMPLDKALYYGYVEEKNGQIVSKDENLCIVDNNNVYVKDFDIISETTISLDEIDNLSKGFSR